ncbi:hypothetical protein OC845_002706 [Tilletia horrida]|nr:hypothetical protein OC845_002706 [Tilletia horrida]
MSEEKTVVILGSGVIGLSTGVALLERALESNQKLKVVLAAQYHPRPLKPEESQDYLQQALRAYPPSYASVWAGDTNDAFMGPIVKKTYEHLVKLESQFQQRSTDFSSAPLHWVDQVEHYQQPKNGPQEPWKDLFSYYPDYQELDKTEDVVFSCSFRTLDIDTRTYLPWLLTRFRDLGGVVLPSFHFKSVQSALNHDNVRQALQGQSCPDAVIVATGHSLPKADVPTQEELDEQEKDFTLRGQVLRIRAPWRKSVGVSRVNEDGFRDLYVLPFSDGPFVVGGTRVPNDVDPNPQDNVTDAILARVLPLVPDLRKPDASTSAPLRDQVDIFAIGVGLRPSRKGGPRIELDSQGVEKDIKLVWCYGFGGTGYQSSWGAAFHVCELLGMTSRPNSRQ